LGTDLFFREGMLYECLCLADFLSSEFSKTTALPYNFILELIKATAFTKYVYDYLTEKVKAVVYV
jgi:hypothetical protein